MSKLEAINPRTGLVDYEVTASSADDIQAAVIRLRESQVNWAADSALRANSMLQWADALEAHSEAMMDALINDTGRRLLSHVEVSTMAARIRFWAERFPALLEQPEQRSVSAANVSYKHQLVPYSVVGVISPWNFPLTLSLVDAIPALCAGCSVILKPSEITPRFAAVLKTTIEHVTTLASVFEVVVGDGKTGTALIDNVDMICFTGSVATGQKIAVQAAKNFIPACLELGGKDPAIVLQDADIDAAADALLRSAASSSGQACMSIERIYAHEKIFDDLVAALSARAAKAEFNAPNLRQGVLTPFIDQRQAAKVRTQLQDAIAKGAKLQFGGEPQLIDGGYWMPPTILTNITSDMLLMQDETFGPLLPIISFASDDEALALANDSEFGLSGSVFGEEAHALRVAEGLNVGAIGINDASMTALIHDVEKQSFGYSGLGPSRMGDSGLLRFFRRKAVLVQHDAPAPIDVLNEAGLP